MRSLAISTSAARRLRLPAALVSTAATIVLLSPLPTPPAAQAGSPKKRSARPLSVK
jgi:hypothetical protein